MIFEMLLVASEEVLLGDCAKYGGALAIGWDGGFNGQVSKRRSYWFTD